MRNGTGIKGSKSPMGTYVYKVKTQDFGTEQKLLKVEQLH